MPFNLLQLFLPDLWTPLTYPSDIYPWRAGTVPLAFPSSFLTELSQVSLDAHGRVRGRLWGHPAPGASGRSRSRRRWRRRRQCSRAGHGRAVGELASPGPGRGSGTISFRRKVDELFEPNLVELRCQCWAEILSLRPKKGPGEMETGNKANLSISDLYFRTLCFRLALV